MTFLNIFRHILTHRSVRLTHSPSQFAGLLVVTMALFLGTFPRLCRASNENKTYFDPHSDAHDPGGKGYHDSLASRALLLRAVSAAEAYVPALNQLSHEAAEVQKQMTTKREDDFRYPLNGAFRTQVSKSNVKNANGESRNQNGPWIYERERSYVRDILGVGPLLPPTGATSAKDRWIHPLILEQAEQAAQDGIAGGGTRIVAARLYGLAGHYSQEYMISDLAGIPPSALLLADQETNIATRSSNHDVHAMHLISSLSNMNPNSPPIEVFDTHFEIDPAPFKAKGNAVNMLSGYEFNNDDLKRIWLEPTVSP